MAVLSRDWKPPINSFPKKKQRKEKKRQKQEKKEEYLLHLLSQISKKLFRTSMATEILPLQEKLFAMVFNKSCNALQTISTF